jgi:DNA-binding transcriptional MocR family regulator
MSRRLAETEVTAEPTHSVIDWPRQFAARMSRVARADISQIMAMLGRPDVTSFAGGVPDAALFPHKEIAASCQRILSDPRRATLALQYSASQGYLPLREWLSEAMGNIGIACSPENILITNGCQQALEILGKAFIGCGDAVLVAPHTYMGALQAFNGYEAVYCHVAEERWRRGVGRDGVRPRLGYLMPDFANPTGMSLGLQERRDLLAFAHSTGLPLIEDAAYEKLRYDGPSLPSLRALEAGETERSHVIYCGTFSKTVVPGLRVGWVVAPRSVLSKLVLIKQASDLHCSTLNQMIALDVASEALPTTVERMRATYKARRDAMLAALARHMPPGVTWTRPEGGMFVWVTLPGPIDTAALLPRAVDEARVAFVPGAAFSADGTGANAFRLSFSVTEIDDIERGIERLGALLCALTREEGPSGPGCRRGRLA